MLTKRLLRIVDSAMCTRAQNVFGFAFFRKVLQKRNQSRLSRDQTLRCERTRTGRYLFFSVQLTTSRIGNLLPGWFLTLAVCDDHPYIHQNIHPYIYTCIHTYQCEWHRMTRMTGPDCVVMCNLINTYIHTYIHTYIELHTYRGFRNKYHWSPLGRINASGIEWLGWQGRIARLCAI